MDETITLFQQRHKSKKQKRQFENTLDSMLRQMEFLHRSFGAAHVYWDQSDQAYRVFEYHQRLLPGFTHDLMERRFSTEKEFNDYLDIMSDAFDFDGKVWRQVQNGIIIGAAMSTPYLLGGRYICLPMAMALFAVGSLVFHAIKEYSLYELNGEFNHDNREAARILPATATGQQALQNLLYGK